MSTTSTKRELGNSNEEESELRRGPWTLEEDSLLIHYIARHGEGRWNMLAKSAGIDSLLYSLRLVTYRNISSLSLFSLLF